MLKRIKTVSMMLLLSALAGGVTYAFPATAGVNIVQQESKCTGTVKDKTGEPIIGASVLVKGTTNGTITDLDGNFNIPDVPQGAIIQISYIGYTTQEVKFNGQPINVELIEDNQTLDEVVVTALGIKREKKALGYSMSEVKGASLTQTRDANVANALAGKVAGLQIKQNGTGVGGSSRIVIRGNNSIGGNNQPLVVVDGVPIDNFNGGDNNDYWGNGNIDKGSGISDISPDDIESMSVLKGPAAAALYGSRAGNGVIMITTKKGGEHKGIGVTYNTNFTFENPMQTPKFQNSYGQGAWHVDKNDPNDKDKVTFEGYRYDPQDSSNWGPALDGKNIETPMGSLPYSNRGNDLYKDFLQTGTSWTNSVDLSKSTESMTFRAGVTRLDNKGIVPNSGMDRTSINLRSTAQLAKWLSADMKINYVNQHTKNRTKLAADPDNIFMNYLSFPRNIAFSDYDAFRGNNWVNPNTGLAAGFLSPEQNNANNPYWSAYRNTNSDKKDRFIGFAALDFQLTNWLDLKLRSGMDNYTIQYESIYATGTPFWEQEGSMTANIEKFTEINSDFLLTAKGNWNKFGIVGTFGGNIMYRTDTWYKEISGKLNIKDFYAIANGQKHDGEYTKNRKQINSLYATASMSWDDFLYLDLSARNDWSSTLPKSNNSYFYPSVGVSWIFTQMLSKMGKDLGPISFGKIRGSWAQVGNDTDAYQLLNYYNIGYDIKGGSVTASPEKYQVNPDLKSETVESWEVGLELKAFDNRLGVDVAYYKKNAKDQILKIDVPAGTGYEQKYINAGNIQNEGWELALTGTPVRNKNFTWDTQLNWSKNKNKVKSLTNGTDQQMLSDTSVGFIDIVAKVGGAYGDMYGYPYLRDDNGNIVVGEDGVPLKGNDKVKLGNNQPKWMAGWSNTFSYKNFTFSFMIDMRYGGDVYMGSIRTGATKGSLAMTEDRSTRVVPGVTTSGQANTVACRADQYWNGLSDITEAWIYDATNIRLRELSLGYSFPRSILSKTPFTNLKLSFVARNLWMIHSKTEGFDPEAAYSSGNAQGLEYGSMPTSRSLGFNLSVSF